jgi:hypothetical protein
MAQARGTVLTESAREVRTGPSEFGVFQVMPGERGEIEVLLDLDPIEYLDPSFVLWFHIYEQMPDSSWRHVVGAQFTGGASFDDELGVNPNPRFWFAAQRVAGKNVRVRVEDAKGRQVGYTVTSRT